MTAAAAVTVNAVVAAAAVAVVAADAAVAAAPAAAVLAAAAVAAVNSHPCRKAKFKAEKGQPGDDFYFDGDRYKGLLPKYSARRRRTNRNHSVYPCTISQRYEYCGFMYTNGTTSPSRAHTLVAIIPFPPVGKLQAAAPPVSGGVGRGSVAQGAFNSSSN